MKHKGIENSQTKRRRGNPKLREELIPGRNFAPTAAIAAAAAVAAAAGAGGRILHAHASDVQHDFGWATSHPPRKERDGIAAQAPCGYPGGVKIRIGIELPLKRPSSSTRVSRIPQAVRTIASLTRPAYTDPTTLLG